MKYLMIFLLALFGNASVYAADLVNVQYLHNLISREHQVDVKYNTSLDSPSAAVNMKYLLTAVDIANKKLNGVATTDYANSSYATLDAVDTIAAIDAVNRLIKKTVVDDEEGGDTGGDDTGGGEETVTHVPEFWITPAGTSTSFSFNISAAGDYVIDWGDGSDLQVINKTNTNDTAYSHTYSNAASNYKIGVSGQATAYSTGDETPAVSFKGSRSSWLGTITSKISAIEGCLGCVFSTLESGEQKQPRFYETFANNSALPSLPDELFSGIYGDSTSKMFRRTFQYCSGLKALPSGLFAGLRGQPAEEMFSSTFERCTALESLPPGLLDAFYGVPVYKMFNNTFTECTSLKEIPSGLFKNINGAPAAKVFNYTFSECTKLTSIPDDLFGDISGDLADETFTYMFYGCTGLTGDSAKINGRYLYEIWPEATAAQVQNMYQNCSKLDDYSTMPEVWR